MFDVILESLVDILKTMPILLLVYVALYILEDRIQAMPAMLEKMRRLGPAMGAVVGVVPQCGFSAAASTLYNSGYLAPATLVAVFLSTSDEAIPILLSQPGAAKSVGLLIVCKLLLAILSGYILQLTVFRKERGYHEQIAMTKTKDCSCCGTSAAGAIVGRTIKTTLFLLVTMLAINLVVYWIGQDALSSILLSGSLLQPMLCALIGLIPGCATSVLLTSLFLNGTISFGAVLAGLSTGAGFGYVLLLQKENGRKHAFGIILATYVAAVAGGTLMQLFSL